MPETEKTVLEKLMEDGRYTNRIKLIRELLRVYFAEGPDQQGGGELEKMKGKIAETLQEAFYDEQDDFDGREIYAYGVLTVIKNIRNEIFPQEDVGPEEEVLREIFVELFKGYVGDAGEKFREAYGLLHQNRFVGYGYGRKSTPELTQKGKNAAAELEDLYNGIL